MCTEFERNRKKLTALIHTLGEFTIEKIEDIYHVANGNYMVDGHYSIEGYVHHLAEVGTLERVGNRYRLSKQPMIPT